MVGMALPWLLRSIRKVNITVICWDILCQHIRRVVPHISLFDVKGIRPMQLLRISFEHLVFGIPQFSYLPSNLQQNAWDSYPCGSFLPFFREFNNVNAQPSHPLQVLYLPRPVTVHANRRSVVNEDALLMSLRNVKGIDLRVFEHSTVEEDAKVFHSVDVVVGLHGGALCNLVYCRKNTVIMELNTGENQGRQCFGYMAHNLHLQYWRYGLKKMDYISTIPDFYDGRITVNVTAFISFFQNSLKLPIH